MEMRPRAATRLRRCGSPSQHADVLPGARLRGAGPPAAIGDARSTAIAPRLRPGQRRRLARPAHRRRVGRGAPAMTRADGAADGPLTEAAPGWPRTATDPEVTHEHHHDPDSATSASSEFAGHLVRRPARRSTPPWSPSATASACTAPWPTAGPGHLGRAGRRRPAPTSATSASGSPRRRRAASSSTTPAPPLLAAGRARVRAGRRRQPDGAGRALPGRRRRGRRPRPRWPSASAPGAGSAGTSTTTTCSAAPSASSAAPTAASSSVRGCRRSTALVERLEQGVRVADVGCGHGISTVLMAEAFPASSLHRLRPPRRLDRDRPRARGRLRRHRSDPLPSRRRSRPPGRRTSAWSASSTRSTTWATRSRGRPPRAGRAGAGRRPAWWSSRWPATARGQPEPDRPPLLRVLDARLHAGLAVAAGPRRPRHAGRRGAPARGAPGEAGLPAVRRVAETPFNIVLEARP